MKGLIKNKLNDKSAQALPEFAICLPVIVLMCGILITVCQLVYAKQIMQTSAFSGCRAYVTNFSETTAKEHAQLTADYAGMKIWLQDVIIKESALDCTNVDGNPRFEINQRSSYARTGYTNDYVLCECETVGYVNLLFPVIYNNEQLMPNVTQVNGYCAMVREDSAHSR